MKIYSPPDNHILSKIVFTARISNTILQHEVVPYGHKNKQFQEHYSLFTSPTLELSPGKYIFGTHSIMRAIAPKAHSLTPFQQVSNPWLRHKSISGLNWSKRSYNPQLESSSSITMI